jgi:hypothetical protein
VRLRGVGNLGGAAPEPPLVALAVSETRAYETTTGRSNRRRSRELTGLVT